MALVLQVLIGSGGLVREFLQRLFTGKLIIAMGDTAAFRVLLSRDVFFRIGVDTLHPVQID